MSPSSSSNIGSSSVFCTTVLMAAPFSSADDDKIDSLFIFAASFLCSFRLSSVCVKRVSIPRDVERSFDKLLLSKFGFILLSELHVFDALLSLICVASLKTIKSQEIIQYPILRVAIQLTSHLL